MKTSEKLIYCKITSFLFLFAGVIAVYIQTLNSPFVLDDQRILEQEQQIRDISNFFQLKTLFSPRPLVNLSFAVNYRLAGLNIKLYHATNLIIHIANTIIVYFLAGLLLSLSGRNEIADNIDANQRFLFSFFAAALFALHPIQSQPIIYISQRATLMVCFFYMLSVICYIIGRRFQIHKRSGYWHWLLLLLCVLFGFMAFLSKENAASLPLAIVLIEVLFFNNSWEGWGKKLPFIFGIMALMVLAFAWISGAFHGDLSDFLNRIDRLTRETTTISRWQYLCTQFTVILLYLKMVIIPMGFNIDHDYPMKSGFFEDATPIAFCLLLGVITLAVLYRKKYKLLSFGILWFFIALSVESSIIPIRDAMFEHRVYLAFPGISILLSFILTQTMPIKETGKIFICGAIILGCTVITYSRAKVWTSELSLWQDASQKAPHNARAWNNYGNALIANGQKDQAADAFQNAINVNPEYARPYCNLGKFYAEKGDLTKSEKLFLKSIELDPKFAEPHNNLAINYASSGNLEKGIQHFQKSLKINPNIAHTHYNMGKVYLDADQPEEALKHFLRATSLNPDLNPMVYYLTAAAYASMNQPESAAQWVTEAIKRGIDQSIEHIKTDPRFASCRESVLSKISN